MQGSSRDIDDLPNAFDLLHNVHVGIRQVVVMLLALLLIPLFSLLLLHGALRHRCSSREGAEAASSGAWRCLRRLIAAVSTEEVTAAATAFITGLQA